jgi:hypothetical protein
VVRAAARSGLLTEAGEPFDREVLSAFERDARTLLARAADATLGPEAADRARRRAALLAEPAEALGRSGDGPSGR